MTKDKHFVLTLIWNIPEYTCECKYFVLMSSVRLLLYFFVLTLFGRRLGAIHIK
jgi:hypothetical protein